MTINRFLRNFYWGSWLAIISLSVSHGQFFNRPTYDTTSTQGIQYRVEIGGLASSKNTTPFWLQSNQFGTISRESPSGIAAVELAGLWGDARQTHRPYVKAAVEVVGNLNRASRLVLPQAYAAVRWGHGELYVGRRKEINGLTDTLLSSGSIAWSGNALPITQIRLGTRDFAPLKFTNGFIAVNAFFSHGWFANSDSMRNVKLHAKSLFIRLGKPTSTFRLYGGINHFVQWGGYTPYVNRYPNLPVGSLTKNGYIPSDWKAYKAAVLPIGQPGGDERFTTIDTLNQIGNHLGSIDFGMDAQVGQSNLYAYYQHLYEDNSDIKFQNFPDGLFGLRWKNLSKKAGQFIQIKQLTVECLTSLNRSGTDPIYGGDDYFFNAQYLGGWTNQNNVIGTPVFTRTADIPAEVRRSSNWLNRDRSINNNAVQTFHLGLYALLGQQIPIVLMATTNKYHEWPNTAKYYNQFYSSLEINNISLGRSNGLKAGVKLAYDTGAIFTSNFGTMLTIRKTGIIR